MKVPPTNEPQLICPKCKSTIKLTQSLAAPLIAKTRKEFKQQLADGQADFPSERPRCARRRPRSKAHKTINDEVQPSWRQSEDQSLWLGPEWPDSRSAPILNSVIAS